jgi:hypothetical protein
VLVADLYGPMHYGQINGVIALCVTASRALAPVSAGTVYDWAGHYDPVPWGLLVASAVATVAVLAVRKRDRSSDSHGQTPGGRVADAAY